MHRISHGTQHPRQSCHQFRLFLSADIHPKLPTALLRTSDMIITDTPTGVKASMQHFLATIPTTRMEKAPGQRRRLYLLLAWLHAVVMERLRYAPIGWSKRYEFAETDAACTLSVSAGTPRSPPKLAT
jgi:dynein heavy chain 1, cytosolic